MSMIDAYRPTRQMTRPERVAQAARACRTLGYSCALIELDDVEELLRVYAEWEKRND